MWAVDPLPWKPAAFSEQVQGEKNDGAASRNFHRQTVMSSHCTIQMKLKETHLAHLDSVHHNIRPHLVL